MILIAVVCFFVGLLLIDSFFSHKSVKVISYSTLVAEASHGKVLSRASLTPAGSLPAR